MQCNSLAVGKELGTVFTRIKPLPLKPNQSIVNKKSGTRGKLDINSNLAKKRGGSARPKVNVVKSEDVKPFSTRPVCTCPHPASSSSKSSKGTSCPLHPSTMGHIQHAAKSTCASLKEPSTRVSLRRHKSPTHPGTSSSSQRKSTSSSADSIPSFPGCTCPSFYSKSKESASICQVNPC